jgi:hypothetical protein
LIDNFSIGRAEEMTAFMSVIQNINVRSNGKQVIKLMAIVKLMTCGNRFPGWLISSAICMALEAVNCTIKLLRT